MAGACRAALCGSAFELTFEAMLRDRRSERLWAAYSPERLDIALRRVGSGDRFTFTNPGEQLLDQWMDANAFVTWIAADNPWLVEKEILRSQLPLPLNVRDNNSDVHTSVIKEVRARAIAQARALPIVADSGGPRIHIQRGSSSSA
jgi:hypothetical protein